MRESIEKDQKYLMWYSNQNPAYFGDCKWLSEKYFPAIKRFELRARSKAARRLLSDTYYKVGDIFFFLNAPLESTKYFKLSVKWDASHGAAYREWGSRLSEMGKYKTAIPLLKRAVTLFPDDPFSKDELAYAISSLKKKPSILYMPSSIVWRADELLAQGRFTAALKALKTSKNSKILQRRARAFGGLKNAEAFIHEWQHIAQQSDKIEMERPDWFFMPDEVWDDSRFWVILLQCKERLVHGAWPYHKSLNEKIVPPIKSVISDSPAGLKRLRKRLSLYCKYHIARTNKDPKMALRLAREHRQWTEIQKLAKKLSGSASVPRPSEWPAFSS